MEDYVVSTLPIKPRVEPVIGMMIAPTLVELLGRKLKIERNFAVNLLNSYNDLTPLIVSNMEYVSSYDFDFSHVVLDTEHVDSLLEGIDKLINKGFIGEKNIEKYICDCGFVDTPVDAISNYNNGKIYKMEEDQIVCSHCNSVCKRYNDASLFFDLASDKFSHDIQVIPNFEKKEIDAFDKNPSMQFYLISRNRQTGYTVKYGGRTYNVDIDALWMNFPQIYNKKNQLYVASNHQLYPIYVMNLLNNALGEKSVTYILSPYLSKAKNCYFDIEKLYEYSSIYAKLSIISSLRWRNKNCTWENSILKGLKKYDSDILHQLYDEMVSEDISLDHFNQNLESFLIDGTAFQHSIGSIKRLIKSKNVHCK